MVSFNPEYVQELVERIQRSKKQEQKYSDDIKHNYAVIMNDLQLTDSVVTKNIESRYKEIERLFQSKQRQIEIQSLTEKELKRELGIL